MCRLIKIVSTKRKHVLRIAANRRSFRIKCVLCSSSAIIQMMSDALPIRPRRLRLSAPLRNMLQRVTLRRSDIIVPLFVTEGEKIRREVSSMPGVFQMSVDIASDWLARTCRGRFWSIFGFWRDRTIKKRCNRLRCPRSGKCRLQIAARSETKTNPDDRHHRFVFLRIHRPRPLRPAQRRQIHRAKRRDSKKSRQTSHQPCNRRRTNYRSQRHDGRSRRRPPQQVWTMQISRTFRSCRIP